MNIGEALPRNAQHFPHKPALVEKKGVRTYLDLHLRTNRLANYLLKQGVAPGDPVVLSCGSRSEHFEILFALAKIGAIAVPFDFHWSPAECEAMIRFFKPKAFIVETRKETTHLPAMASALVEKRVIIGLDYEAAAQTVTYEEVLASGNPGDPTVSVEGKDLFLVMITSGTTGFPKACAINHETYVLRSINNAISKGLNRHQRALLTLPLHFNAGRGTMIGMLYLGSTVFIHERFDEEAFLSTVEREKITYTVLVSTLCDRLLRYPDLARFDLSTLRYVGITGGHLSYEVSEAMMRRVCPALYESYASTDCGQMSILAPEDRLSHNDTVGRPIWCVTLRIVDEAGEEIPLDREGEICVRTPLAVQGYYRNPEATEEFLAGGWCHTGDIGFLDSDGFLHISGRKKNMIKSGGISIFPEEIEGVLKKHPDVADAAVAGYRSAEWGEGVKALVVLNQGASCEPEALIGFCKESLARYKAPKVVEFVSSLPRTGLGKLDRGKLGSEHSRQ